MGFFDKFRKNRTVAESEFKNREDVNVYIEKKMNERCNTAEYQNINRAAAKEAEKTLSQLGIQIGGTDTQEAEFRREMQVKKEDYIKPENINTENMISNILIYLGVGPELANNPIVKEKWLEEISGIRGPLRDDERQEWLEQFVASKSDIGKQIIPNLRKKYVDAFNLCISVEDYYSLREREISISRINDENNPKNNGIIIAENGTREYYNQDNILIKKEFNARKMVIERDSENPFIIHQKIRGPGGTEENRILGLTRYSVADMEIFSNLPNIRYPYGDENEQEFYDRMKKEGKLEMDDIRRFGAKSPKNAIFIKYVDKKVPYLCEEKSTEGRGEL